LPYSFTGNVPNGATLIVESIRFSRLVDSSLGRACPRAGQRPDPWATARMASVEEQ
jgi:hypothetical protein